MMALSWAVLYDIADLFVNRKGLGQDGVAGWRGKENLRLAGHGLVRRRHTHGGAPDDRINGSLKSMS